LVKLNLQHPDLRKHLFDAVRTWINQFDIDGLRLDAADVIDLDFLRDLASFCRSQRPDFWLMGEVIHGDYRKWANPQTLDSSTNYECYKGLYSSLNDRNYFEIAYALNRQFGEQGIYRDLTLYNFVDNHDVARVASNLHNPAHLIPLYALLFTIPGVPSIYYGSEWGITGVKETHNDLSLRPALGISDIGKNAASPELMQTIKRFTRIRHDTPALMYGDYRPLHVSHELLAFSRSYQGKTIVVAINAANQPVDLSVKLDSHHNGQTFIDLLEPHRSFTAQNGNLKIESIPPCSARILA
jgi:glycosidase